MVNQRIIQIIVVFGGSSGRLAKVSNRVRTGQMIGNGVELIDGKISIGDRQVVDGGGSIEGGPDSKIHSTSRILGLFGFED